MNHPHEPTSEFEGEYIAYEENDPYEDYTRFPLLSFIALLSIPVFGYLSLSLGADQQRHGGSGASWVPTGLFMSIFYLLGTMLVSLTLALMSRPRKERFRVLRFIVYGLCGLPLSFAAVGFLCLLIATLFGK